MYKKPSQLINYILIVLTVIFGATVGTSIHPHINTYQQEITTYESR